MTCFHIKSNDLPIYCTYGTPQRTYLTWCCCSAYYRPPFSRAIFDATQILRRLDNLGDTGSIWQLGAPEDGEGAKLVRVGDVSPNGAFGRCLVYRVDVSGLPSDEMARLCKELCAFRLCREASEAALIRPPVPVHKISSGMPLNGWEVTERGRSLYRGLQHRVKFLIQVSWYL